MSGPDFDELVGEGPGEERQRLRGVHELLIAAGPPPELPPSLASPGAHDPSEVRLAKFPRRRLAAAVVLAAALVLASFGAGYLVGERGADRAVEQKYVVVMRGTGAASGSLASLVVGERDAAGNWPMELTVYGLRPLPGGARYELLLTRRGRIAESCGTFAAAGTKTVVLLNAPYRLRRYTGWVVTRAGNDRVLMRTRRI